MYVQCLDTRLWVSSGTAISIRLVTVNGFEVVFHEESNVNECCAIPRHLSTWPISSWAWLPYLAPLTFQYREHWTIFNDVEQFLRSRKGLFLLSCAVCFTCCGMLFAPQWPRVHYAQGVEISMHCTNQGSSLHFKPPFVLFDVSNVSKIVHLSVV